MVVVQDDEGFKCRTEGDMLWDVETLACSIKPIHFMSHLCVMEGLKPAVHFL